MITGLGNDPHQQEKLERDLQDQGLQQLGLRGHQEDQQLQDLQGELGTQGPLEDPEPLNVKNQDHQGDQGALNDKSQDPLNEPKILDPQEDRLIQDPQEDLQLQDRQEELIQDHREELIQDPQKDQATLDHQDDQKARMLVPKKDCE